MSTDICRWLVLLISLSTWTSYTSSKEMRVVCYYTNWSVYRPGTAKFSPQNINPYLCTHLIYAFGGFTKENTLKPFDKYQDIEKGGYAKFTGLKTYNKNLKTLLAIGGWNEGSSRFSPMVANPERRKELVKNAIKFLRQNHFDGLDLDWEYPTFRDGGKARDRDNYAQLVKELREEFERESEKTGRTRLLLTMAVPAGIEYINKGYDIPKLTKYLDWMNILSYDYHSAFEPAVNHHAPLYGLEEDSEYNYDADLNIDHTIKHYLEKGADPGKLVLGIPTYGRSYTLFNPDANELGAPADGPGDMGEATRENGYLAYYEICEYVKDNGWEVVQPNEKAMGPYAFKDNQWVGYDDEKIVRRKAEYVAENKLGGIMFWAIDNDDFRGSCHGRPYPLIEAAKEALLNAYGITDDNLIAPTPKPLKPKRTRTRTEEVTEASEKHESSPRRRNRNKSRTSSKRKETRKSTEKTSTYSSLKVVTPSYTTPAPPSTPDQGGAFKCEDEGFFPHPKDCKKYFWCLAGAGDNGIIAHQFTCPAGLYFNKAADSCDYTQNVLCNKKLSRTTSTTSTEAPASSTTSKPSSIFSTSRLPPRTTPTTSRTTTTAAYDDDDDYEEYEDEEEGKKIDSEEDPRVIKELIELIRKAGGIEELEKRLKGDSSSSSGTGTTASSISKSLVERVLSGRTNLNTKKTNFLNRNSRGPQNAGIHKEEDEGKVKVERGRPQYTSITRNRPNKTEDEESRSFKKSENEPEYVNIRRNRFSTTTEPSEDEKIVQNRNKLGEDGYQVEEDEDEEEEESTSKKKIKNNHPQYVNIRRQRPSTTEGPTTPKYTVLRRGTTTESAVDTEDEPDVTTSKYKTIRRGTTTTTTQKTEEPSSKYVYLRRSTTPSTPSEETSKYNILKRGPSTESQTLTEDPSLKESTTASTTTENDKYKTFRRGSTTLAITSTFLENDKKGSTPLPNLTVGDPTFDLKIKHFSSTSEKSTISNKEIENINGILGFSTVGISTTSPTVDVTTFNNIDGVTVTPQSISTHNPVTLLQNTEANLDSKISKLPSLTSTTETLDEDRRTPPQLLEPRPFSIIRGSTVKPTVETTKATKVSDHSTLRKDQEVHNNNHHTELDGRTRARGASRFSLNRDDNTESTVRTRKRFSTTTETAIAEDYYVRNYRPSELADLSSLTAADIALKEKEAAHHRRRLRPTTTTSTTTAEEEPLKTGFKTLTIARKQLENTTFGKGRRITPSPRESSPRTRKVIRRLKPTTPTPLESRRSNRTRTANQSLHQVFSKRPNRFPNLNQEESESEEISNEEGENIKLSESTIRESSDVNNNDITDVKGRRKITRLIESDKSDVEKASKHTEPPIIVRTRKIIRKYRPTTEVTSGLSSTTPSENLEAESKKPERVRTIIRRPGPGQKRKIILLGKPSTAVEEGTTRSSVDIRKTQRGRTRFNLADTTIKTVETTRRTTFKPSTTIADLDLNIEDEYEGEIDDDEEEDENINRESELNKPLLTVLSTTTISSIVDETEDEEEENVGKEIEDSSGEEKETSSARSKLLHKFGERPAFIRPKSTTKATEESEELDTANLSSTTATTRKFGRQRSRGFTRSSTTTEQTKIEIKPKPRLQIYSRTSPSTTISVDVNTTTAETSTSKADVENSTLQTESTTIPIYTTTIDGSTTIGATINTTTADTSTIKSATIESTTINTTTTEENENNSSTETNTTSELETTTTEEPIENTTLNLNLTEDTDSISSTAPSLLISNRSEESDTTLSSLENTTLTDTITTDPSITESITESTINTTKSELNITETTTEYTRKSTLKPIQSRPKYTISKDRLSKTPETSTRSNKFSFRRKPSKQNDPEEENKATPDSIKTTALPINKFIYKYSTTPRTRLTKPEIEEDNEEQEEIIEKEEPVRKFKPKFKPSRTTQRTVNRPRPKFEETEESLKSTRTSNRPFSGFKKSTENPVTEPLDIDTEAVKNRNKNLFSKKRKMNTPFSGSTKSEDFATASPITEASTKPSHQETTESLTTLHHIFAETEKPQNGSFTGSVNSKEEKLIEVNRIIEVYAGENKTENKVELLPIVDKIGAISRVTVIKVVGGNTTNETLSTEDNEIRNMHTVEGSKQPDIKLNIQGDFIVPEIAKVQEVKADDLKKIGSASDIPSNHRQDKKYEIYGESKVIDYSNLNKLPHEAHKAGYLGPAEIIDGISNINIITPRPIYSTEASTISLERLFQTDSPQSIQHVQKNILNNVDELLETENSRFVNIRILNQDTRTNKEIRTDSKFVPIRILKDEEEVTLKAEVVEVPKKEESIKIVPIKVEMARKLLPIFTVNKNEKS